MDYSQKLLKYKNLKHFFSSKIDGNLAFHVGDSDSNVLKNHQNLAKKHNYDLQNLLHMKQIHSDSVHIVKSGDDFNNPPTCDALITKEKNRPLMVMVADCSPILFYDDIQRVIAVAHVGRAGAFKNIIKNTVDELVFLGSKPKDIVVCVGANIKSCCYEVGEEIFKEAKELNLDYSVQKRDEKLFLDIDSIITKQLKGCGVVDVEFLPHCTSCTKDSLYSYRAEGKTGRFAGVIELI